MRQTDAEKTISRQQKVMAAKAAFGNSGFVRTSDHGSFGSWGTGAASDVPVIIQKNGNWQNREAVCGPEEEWRARHSFGLIRFMAAGMLLLILVVAFHQGFSYEGFDQAYVQEKLNDEASWNRLEEQVLQVFLSLDRKSVV